MPAVLLMTYSNLFSRKKIIYSLFEFTKKIKESDKKNVPALVP